MKRHHRAHDVDLRSSISTDISPFHLLLAVLLHVYAVYVHENSSDSGEGLDEDMSMGYKGQERRLRDLLLKLIRGRDSIYQLKVEELVDLLHEELGPTGLADTLQLELVTFLENMNNLDDLVHYAAENLDVMFVKSEALPEEAPHSGLLETQTEFGQFAREVSLALKSLQFEALCLLFSELQVYGRPLVGPAADNPTSASPHACRKRERRKALETFVMHQNKMADTQGKGRLKPRNLEELVSELELSVPDMAAIHRLRFHIAMEQEDHMTAINALQRYFDYSLGARKESTTDAENPKFANALLNLGAVHAHFGDHKNAMLALNETVRVAQQMNDDTVLQHALAQLCHLLDSCPAAAQEDGKTMERHEPFSQLYRLLQRCQKCSRELCLPHLEAYARVMLAKFRWEHFMRKPDTPDMIEEDVQVSGLQEVQQTLQTLADLNYRAQIGSVVPQKPHKETSGAADNEQPVSQPNDMYPTSRPIFSPALSGQEEASAEAVEQLAGSSQLLRASACLLAGKRLTAHASIRAFLAVHADTASVEDCCLAYAQLAYSTADSEGYKAGIQIIEQAKTKYPASSLALTATSLCLEHGEALNRDELQRAEHLAKQIIAVAGSVQHLNKGIRFEGQRRLVECLIQQDRISEAELQGRAFFESCQDAGMQAEATRMLLTLCEVHRACDAPTLALPYAEACHKHASAMELNLLAAEAQTHMADLYSDLHLKPFDQCRELLLEVMPLVSGNGSRQQRALLHWTLAMVHLKHLTKAELPAWADKIQKHLTTASQIYVQMGNKRHVTKCFQFIAMVAHSIGDVQLRDDAAYMCQKGGEDDY